MKVHFQRLISLLLALVLCLSLFVLPASAAESEPVTSTGTFWQAAAADSPRVIGNLIGIFSKGTCAVSEDRRHHGKVIRKADPVFGEPGAWLALCDYCGEEFKVYDDDMQNAYDEHVGQIQENYGTILINSSYCLVYPIGPFGHSIYPSSNHYTFVSTYLGGFSAISDGTQDRGDMSVYSNTFSLPKPGEYLLHFRYSFSNIFSLSNHVTFQVSLDRLSPASYSIPFFLVNTDHGGFGSGIVEWKFPSSLVAETFQVHFFAQSSRTGTGSFSSSDVCLVSLSPLSDPLFTNSRVGTFSGNFGYYGDNGQLVVAENIQIVNEGDKTFYNPATGATSPITDWTYDYLDRSYNLTLDGGTTTTVTYGDENVTIKEGDTTYNIYYIVQGSGGGEVDPSPSPTVPPSEHVHRYASTVTTEPTCVGAGSKTYTCSECGDTYAEKIPATGHSWTVDRTINTTYDEDGNVLTQGYTIYRCSVCGNEYKDETGSGPPDDGKDDGGGQGFLGWLGEKLGELLGAIGDGILGLIQAALGKILDGLIALVNMISEKLATVVEVFFDCLDVLPSIFSGFTDFLTAGFAFLPPEVITVITFGILMMVLVAIIKLFLK